MTIRFSGLIGIIAALSFAATAAFGDESIPKEPSRLSPDEGLNDAVVALKKSVEVNDLAELRHSVWRAQFESARYIAVYGESSWQRRSPEILRLLEAGVEKLEQFSPKSAQELKKRTEALVSSERGL